MQILREKMDNNRGAKIMCDFDCFNCVFSDCINDSSVRQEILYKYNHSTKGKARMKKYNNSLKGKERAKRYISSEKGKEKQRKATQRDIKNGKNAERCRRYYQRKKGIEKL